MYVLFTVVPEFPPPAPLAVIETFTAPPICAGATAVTVVLFVRVAVTTIPSNDAVNEALGT